MNPRKYLELAANVSRLKDDDRTYFHGAVGLRRDGVLVAACNGNPKTPTPEHHCEFRLTKKLGMSGIVFVVRTLADGSWANSRPCETCQAKLRNSKVKRVYYSTGTPVEYAYWCPASGADWYPAVTVPHLGPVGPEKAWWEWCNG